MFSDADFAAGTHQAFPLVGDGRNLAGKKNLNASLEEVACGRVAGADGLGVRARAAAVKAGRKHAGIVEDDQVAGTKQAGQITELAIGKASGGAKQMQHARTVAIRKGFLRDEFVRK